jgi:beta-phosphoglucomutase-like phosphatase (HAD superfamily)
MKLKALIFDVDGTLADTEGDGHRVAFNESFRENKLDFYWDEDIYEDLLSVTGGKERMKFFIQKYSPKFDIPTRFDGLEEFIKHLHKEKTKYYVKLIQDGKVPLRVGVKRLIDEARKEGVTLAISTTTTMENVTSLLSKTLGEESIDWFKVIGAGDVVSKKKPANDIYVWVLEKLGLDASECVAIEDSYNGVISSKDANIKTIITTNKYTKNHDFSIADLVVDSLGCDGHKVNVLSGELDSNVVDIKSINELL